MIDPVLQRKMFSPKQEEKIDQGLEVVSNISEGQGITSGLVEIANDAQQMVNSAEEASDYEQLMNAVREEPASMKERVGELAEVVGNADAKKTPESVLAFMQPYFGLLETAEKGAQMQQDPTMGVGITAGLVDEPMQAPGQQEAMMRMAMGEQPVMLSGGGDKEDAEQGKPNPFFSQADLASVEQLQQLVPAAKTYDDYYDQYKALLEPESDPYRFNNVLAGLQLASAVANAPRGELFQSILDPQTIKNVSDPILQAAQARSKQDQAIKLKAADAAAKSASAESSAKSDIMMKVVDKALEDNTQIVETNDGGIYSVNKNTNALSEIRAGNTFTEKVEVNGATYLVNPRAPADKRNVEGTGYIKFGKEKGNFTMKVTDNGQVLSHDNDTGQVTVKSPQGFKGKTEILIDPETNNFLLYDYSTGKADPVLDSKGKPVGGLAPDATIRQVNELVDAKQKARKLVAENKPIPPALADQIKLLAGKIEPQGTEFERLLDQKLDLVRKEYLITNPDDTTGAEKAVNDYKSAALQSWVTKETTKTLNYDPKAELNKVSATALQKKIDGLTTKAEDAQELGTYAKIVADQAQNFQSGSLAGTRLAAQKLIKALPGAEEFIKAGLSTEAYNAIFGGSVVSAEVADQAASQFTLRMSQYIQGNLNAEELKEVKKAGPSIYTTKEGLEWLSNFYSKVAERTRNEKIHMDDWFSQNQNKHPSVTELSSAWTQELNKYRKDNPVGADEETLSQLPATDDSQYTATKMVGNRPQKFQFPSNRDYQTSKFISSFNTFEDFMKNAGGLLNLNVLVDRNGNTATRLPPKQQLQDMWNQFSGYSGFQTQPNQ